LTRDILKRLRLLIRYHRPPTPKGEAVELA
jgi:hypothetical protein